MSSERHPDDPIPISWVSTHDLISRRPEHTERIKALTQADIEYLAGKIGDALQDTYWLAMGIILDDFFNENQLRDELRK